MEKRKLKIGSLRASKKTPKLVGSIPYDSPADIGGCFTEILRAGCFSMALSRPDNIFALKGHDSNQPLANRHAGTLKFRDGQDALEVEIMLDTSISFHADTYAAAKRGDLSGLSFGFDMSKSGERWDGDTREIIEVARLFELSPCTFPAYQKSKLTARSRGRGSKTMRPTKREVIDTLSNLEVFRGRKIRGEQLTKSEQIEMNKCINTWDSRIAPAFGHKTVEEVGVDGVISYMRDGGDDFDNDDRENRSGGRPVQLPESNENQGDDRKRELVNGYELRGPNDDKNYWSLFGNRQEGQVQWRDDSISFFAAVLSGRHHPDLDRRSLTQGTLSDGGYAVPAEYAKTIHDVALESEIVQPRALVAPMKSNEKHLPAFTIGSHASSLYGGFQAAYKAEAAALSEANPKLRDMVLQTKKLTGFIRGSNELAADIIGGTNQLNRICGEGLAWYRDKAFLKGSGSGEPLGVLQAPCLIEVAKESGQAAGTIVYENLTNMVARLWSGSFAKSVFICHQSTIPQLLQLHISIGTAGSHIPVLQGSDGQWEMLTRPVIFTEKTETLGSKGDILLADFSQYVIGLREGMRFDTSQHVYFSTDEFAARLIERHDGQPLWNEALTLNDGSTTVSPFVTLAERS